MRTIFSPKRLENHKKPKKIFVALVDHVYSQTTIAMVTSLLCACVVFVGLYSRNQNNSVLFAWFAFYFVVTVLRILWVIMYRREKVEENKINFWRNLYVIGSMLAGISWGLPSILFFNHASSVQQTLMILMTAGVTAGAIPLSSAIPAAAISFLILSISPYVVTIALTENPTYLLFDVALFIYLIYTIMLSISTYKVIKNSIVLNFENDQLLINLSEAKQQLEIINTKLELTATHDALTTIANRSLFEQNLNQGIKRAKENRSMLALFYMDFDNFKPINDMYGHRVGDHLLKVTTEKLKNLFKNENIIARWGGDEFTIILENVDSIEKVATVAHQVCQLISKPVKHKNIELKITVSIGISLYPYDGHTAQMLQWMADKTMYYVKEHGGNNFYFYRDLSMLDQKT